MSVNAEYFRGLWEQILNDGHAGPNKIDWIRTKPERPQRFKPIAGVMDMSFINGLYIESVTKYPRH